MGAMAHCIRKKCNVPVAIFGPHVGPEAERKSHRIWYVAKARQMLRVLPMNGGSRRLRYQSHKTPREDRLYTRKTKLRRYKYKNPAFSPLFS